MHRSHVIRRALASVLTVGLVAGILITSPIASQAAPTSVKEYLLSRPTERIQPELQDALDNSQPDDVLQILVQFDGMDLQARHIDVLQDLGFGGIITYKILPVAATVGTADQVRALAQHSDVRRLELNLELGYDLDRSTKAVKADEGVWDRYVKENDLIGLPVDGDGVSIAVIDSGVDATHPDLRLGEKTVANKKFIGESVLVTREDEDVEAHGEAWGGVGLWVDTPNSDNTSVHGTHVAGIAAGSGAGSGTNTGVVASGFPEATTRRGVAPGANIFGLGAGETLVVINALSAFDFVYHEIRDRGNPFNIRLINNSWGGPGDFDPGSLLHQAILVLSYDMGADNQHIVFAGGNVDGDPECTNSHGRIPGVVSVAMLSRDGTSVSSGSCKGEAGNTWTFPDVAAPGVAIRSTASHAYTVFPYLALTGTSMAAPHVAGTLALMLQANPDLGLAGVADDFTSSAPSQYADPFLNEITEAEWILKATATRVSSANLVAGASYMPSGTQNSTHDGYGLIDAERAVAAAFALRELRVSNSLATVGDAVAAADGLVENVTEIHDDVDTLSTSWWGTLVTWGTPVGGFRGSEYSLTVPSTFTSLDLELRWEQPADVHLVVEYPLTDGSSETVFESDSATPGVDFAKTVTITPDSIPAGTVTGDPTRPWIVSLIPASGYAYDVDWSITATLTHTGHWDVGRDFGRTYDNADTDPANDIPFELWGDWQDADNGEGSNHVESDEGSSHAIDMRYYDLGSNDLFWAKPGQGTNGSSKFDPRAATSDPDAPATTSIRLATKAWTSWHQSADGVILPPPPGTVIQLLGDTGGQYTDTASVAARLTQDGSPISGQTITFKLGAQSTDVTTGSDGTANASIPLLQPPGSYTLNASFAGDGTLPPASASTPFEITREDSALDLSLIPDGADITLVATLTDADTSTTALGGRDITFTRDGETVGTVTTDPNGVAALLLTSAADGTYAASFAGDAFFLPALSDGEIFDTGTLVSISAVPDPILDAHADHVLVRGDTEPDATLEIVASDGTQTTDPVGATVNDDGAYTSEGIDVRELANGDVTFTVNAVDRAGNEATAQRTVTKDTSVIPPVVKITNAPFGFIEDEKIDIEVTFRGPDASSDIEVQVTDEDGNALEEPILLEDIAINEPQEVSVPTGFFNDGEITATGTFSSGTAADSAILDRGRPTVTIDEPEDVYLGGTLFISTMTFTGTAGDSLSGIDFVWVQLNGWSKRVEIDDAGTWEVSFSGLLPGSYKLEARSIDHAANASDTAEEEVFVL